MATRHYRSWNTGGSTEYMQQTHSYSSSSLPPERPYYNPWRFVRSYDHSNRSLEDTENRAFPRNAGPNGPKFNFVTGRYSCDNRLSTLRDAEEPTYYKEVTELIFDSNKVQQDYRNVLERCSGVRNVIGIRGQVTMGYWRNAKKPVPAIYQDKDIKDLDFVKSMDETKKCNTICFQHTLLSTFTVGSNGVSPLALSYELV